MDLGLRDKVALVTAASGGLGVAMTDELAAEGATVVVSARKPDRLIAAVDGITERTGGQAYVIVADMTEASAVEGLVAETCQRFGGIDVLVNNTGGAATAPFVDFTDDEWRAAAEVKIIPQIRCARLVFRSMLERGRGGRIIFIAGTHGRQPHAHAVTAGFCNAALQNVAKALAEDGGLHDVLVNVVNPGPFATERMVYLAQEKADEDGISLAEATAILADETVLKRYGEPGELAAFVAFVASSRASFLDRRHVRRRRRPGQGTLGSQNRPDDRIHHARCRQPRCQALLRGDRDRLSRRLRARVRR